MCCHDSRNKGAELEKNYKVSDEIVPNVKVNMTAVKGEGIE